MMALSPVRARSCTSRWRRRRTRSSACFSTYARNHRVLHSFPTRRSSDLLILGISPRYGLEARSLTRFAAQFPFAVLFLLDSKSATRAIPSEAHVGFLTKPFNPYELHEKVGQLLALRAATPKTTKTPHDRR